MIAYPNLAAAVEGLDLIELAFRSNVTVAAIEAVLAPGGPTLALGERLRLARALGADPAELFRLAPDVEPGLPPARHVTDPAILRAIDGRRIA